MPEVLAHMRQGRVIVFDDQLAVDAASVGRRHGLAGDSGVVAYEAGPDFIRVRFRNGDTYLYTCESAGAYNVDHMKELAAAGKGLSTFVSRTVNGMYAAKSR